MGKIKELSDVSITAYHPHVHTASAPEPVPAELVLLRPGVLAPLCFRQAVIAVGEAAEPVRVTALTSDMLLTRSTYSLNSLAERCLHR